MQAAASAQSRVLVTIIQCRGFSVKEKTEGQVERGRGWASLPKAAWGVGRSQDLGC